MQAAEGKLFKPLAYTKTFALIFSVIIALTVLPPLAHVLFRRKKKGKASWKIRLALPILLIIAGVILAWKVYLLGLVVVGFGCYRLILQFLPKKLLPIFTRLENWLVILQARSWQPLGIKKGEWSNFFFVALLIGGLLGFFQIFQWLYPHLLRLFLRWKPIFLIFPLFIVIGGAMVWLGVPKLRGWLPDSIRRTQPMMTLAHNFPGLGREFMPALDEGSFLYMPTTMPHAGLTEVQEVLAAQDRAITAIPEVESAVGKLGRAETPLDPAPLSMIETIINYHLEYLEDEKGNLLLFSWRADRKDFCRRCAAQGRGRHALSGAGTV